MRRTSLRGHALRSEGAPYERGEYCGWVRVYGSWTGVGLCECGATSEVLESNNARKRWHKDVHKPEVRVAADGDVTIPVTIPAWEAERLSALVSEEEGLPDLAAVIGKLLDHVQQGACRPGAWEREWLCQAFGDYWLGGSDA